MPKHYGYDEVFNGSPAGYSEIAGGNLDTLRKLVRSGKRLPPKLRAALLALSGGAGVYGGVKAHLDGDDRDIATDAAIASSLAGGGYLLGDELVNNPKLNSKLYTLLNHASLNDEATRQLPIIAGAADMLTSGSGEVVMAKKMMQQARAAGIDGAFFVNTNDQYFHNGYGNKRIVIKRGKALPDDAKEHLFNVVNRKFAGDDTAINAIKDAVDNKSYVAVIPQANGKIVEFDMRNYRVGELCTNFELLGKESVKPGVMKPFNYFIKHFDEFPAVMNTERGMNYSSLNNGVFGNKLVSKARGFKYPFIEPSINRDNVIDADYFTLLGKGGKVRNLAKDIAFKANFEPGRLPDIDSARKSVQTLLDPNTPDYMKKNIIDGIDEVLKRHGISADELNVDSKISKLSNLFEAGELSLSDASLIMADTSAKHLNAKEIYGDLIPSSGSDMSAAFKNHPLLADFSKENISKAMRDLDPDVRNNIIKYMRQHYDLKSSNIDDFVREISKDDRLSNELLGYLRTNKVLSLNDSDFTKLRLDTLNSSLDSLDAKLKSTINGKPSILSNVSQIADGASLRSLRDQGRQIIFVSGGSAGPQAAAKLRNMVESIYANGLEDKVQLVVQGGGNAISPSFVPDANGDLRVVNYGRRNQGVRETYDDMLNYINSRAAKEGKGKLSLSLIERLDPAEYNALTQGSDMHVAYAGSSSISEAGASRNIVTALSDTEMNDKNALWFAQKYNLPYISYGDELIADGIRLNTKPGSSKRFTLSNTLFDPGFVKYMDQLEDDWVTFDNATKKWKLNDAVLKQHADLDSVARRFGSGDGLSYAHWSLPGRYSKEYSTVGLLQSVLDNYQKTHDDSGRYIGKGVDMIKDMYTRASTGNASGRLDYTSDLVTGTMRRNAETMDAFRTALKIPKIGRGVGAVIQAGLALGPSGLFVANRIKENRSKKRKWYNNII